MKHLEVRPPPQKRRRRGKKYSGIGLSHEAAQALLVPEEVTYEGSSSDENDENPATQSPTKILQSINKALSQNDASMASIVANQSYTMSPLTPDNISRISLGPRSPPPPEIAYSLNAESTKNLEIR